MKDDKIPISDGQIVIAARHNNTTYALYTEDFKKFPILVRAAKKKLKELK